MLLTLLIFAAVVLTCTMFATRNSMLGFPSVIFWAIAGGQAYTLSIIDWDIYFLIAFASLLGMVTFTALGAWGLREKRDTIADEEIERGEGEYVDEGNGKKDELDTVFGEAENKPSRRVRELRERAEKRRRGEPTKPRGR